MAGLRVVEEFDPFKLVGREDVYNVNTFYTASRNNHDHSSKETVYVKPDLSARIREVVASDDFPKIKSIQDFFRDAAHHRLQQYTEMGEVPGVDRWLLMERRKLVREEMDLFLAAMTEEIQALEASLLAAQGLGDKTRLEMVIDHYELVLDDFEQPYYDKVKSILKRYKP